MPGAKSEGTVSFPADYGHKPLQGKSVTMRITLTALKEQILPELNDELAKNYGQESLESLKEAIYQSLFSQNKKTMKSKAQQKLMDMLLPKLNFMLPPSLVKTREERILSEARHRLSMPADNEAMEKTIEAMRPAAVKEAELFTRVHIFLIKIAEKENLSVDRREAEMHLYQMAVREGADLSKLREAYERSGLMEELMERILADKAMDFIYDKAVVKNLTPEREEKKAEAKE
jgi:trigger factor